MMRRQALWGIRARTDPFCAEIRTPPLVEQEAHQDRPQTRRCLLPGSERRPVLHDAGRHERQSAGPGQPDPVSCLSRSLTDAATGPAPRQEEVSARALRRQSKAIARFERHDAGHHRQGERADRRDALLVSLPESAQERCVQAVTSYHSWVPREAESKHRLVVGGHVDSARFRVASSGQWSRRA
jgi:hypothetical protein